jgi:hypothetical protein
VILAANSESLLKRVGVKVKNGYKDHINSSFTPIIMVTISLRVERDYADTTRCGRTDSYVS